MTIESFETLEFYRGVNEVVNNTPKVITTNKNRRPRDMPIDFHREADEWFFNRFGTKYRSQSVFVTSSKFTATYYAKNKDIKNVLRIIPLGDYKYCWSSKYADLLAYIQVKDNISMPDFLTAGNYSESDLKAAHTSGNELMLFCEKFIAIPMDFDNAKDHQDVTIKKILII